MLFEHMCDSLWLLPETWALNNMYEACVLGGCCSTAHSATFAMRTARQPGLLRLALPAPGCATHSGRSAEPLRTQWEVLARR